MPIHDSATSRAAGKLSTSFDNVSIAFDADGDNLPAIVPVHETEWAGYCGFTAVCNPYSHRLSKVKGVTVLVQLSMSR